MSPKHWAPVVSLLLALCLPAFSQFPSRSLGPPPIQDTESQESEPGDSSNPRWMTASLTGTVRDLQNHPLGDARVELRNLTTGLPLTTTYTTPDGQFEFQYVPLRAYELVVTAGLSESRQRVDIHAGDANVNVQFPTISTDPSGQSTISVADMKVPDKARNEVHKAEENLGKKKYDEARQRLAKALSIYPRYSKAHMMLGILNLQEDRAREATAELEKAIELDPNNATAFVALASAYNGLEQPADALRALATGTRLAPTSWQVCFETARAKLAMKDFSAALQQAERAEQLSSSKFPTVHLLKANALIGLGDYVNASTELKEYIRRAPQGANVVEARRTLDQMQALTTARK